MTTQPPSSSGSRVDADKSTSAAPSGRGASVRGGLGSVLVRNEFYRDGYRVLQSVAVMQAITIVVMIFVMLYVVHIHQPEYRYFATTEDGRLVPMVPLSEPNLSTPAITSWAAQAATEVMTFGFHDYKQRLQESSKNFTKTGWVSFTKALDAAQILSTVSTQLQVVTSAPTAAPVVMEEGVVNGRYQWRVQVPITTRYKSSQGDRPETRVITMLIVRVPRLESANGVGIEQWIAQ
jgi:intracellular multiplication protein IcmL